MWLFQQYRKYMGYTSPKNENASELAADYYSQLEDAVGGECTLDAELAEAVTSLSDLKFKEQGMRRKYNMCAQALQALSVDDVPLTDEQREKVDNLRLLMRDLEPVKDKISDNIAHLEFTVAVLKRKKLELQKKRGDIEGYLTKHLETIPLRNITVVDNDDLHSSENAPKPTSETDDSPLFLPDETLVPQDTPIIQMMSASLGA